MAQCVRRRQDAARAARPPAPPLRHRRDRQRQLALQKPRRRSRSPRSPRLRNPDQLRRGERYPQNPPLKGVKIGRRYGVKFERRLTALPCGPYRMLTISLKRARFETVLLEKACAVNVYSFKGLDV